MRIRREPYPDDWWSWLLGPLICCVFVAIIGSSGGLHWMWAAPALWIGGHLVVFWYRPKLHFDEAGFSLHPRLIWGWRRDFRWEDVTAWGREQYRWGSEGDGNYVELTFERLAVYLRDGRSLRYQDSFYPILEEELREIVGQPLPLRPVDPKEPVQ